MIKLDMDCVIIEIIAEISHVKWIKFKSGLAKEKTVEIVCEMNL